MFKRLEGCHALVHDDLEEGGRGEESRDKIFLTDDEQ